MPEIGSRVCPARMNSVRACYNAVFASGFLALSPYYFLRLVRRGNWRNGFGQRWGRYDESLKKRLQRPPLFWMHAVSVGEVNVALALLETLRERLPDRGWLMSTTTTTGMAELERKLPPEVDRIYYPVDWRAGVRRALAAFPPQAFILLEAEIWPNFLWELADRGVPAFLVNARMSDRSSRRYGRFGPLFRPLFAGFRGVGVQNRADADRLRTLGVRDAALHITGNLKFDAACRPMRPGVDAPALLRALGVAPGAPILVAGSTHAGEEAILAEACGRLRGRFPDLFLVLVPRHFERAGDVSRELAARGVRFVRRTEIGDPPRQAPGPLSCLLVDTTGELTRFYAAADLVFVGKSLTAEGGQNPIEPGGLGKAMVFGPHMENFAAIAQAFVQGEGAVQVRDAAELERVLSELLADPRRRQILGERAQAIVESNRGAVARTAEMIIEGLRGGIEQHPSATVD